MLKIKFQVTQQDIDQGRTGPNCPIELALKRADVKDPRVYLTSMCLYRGGPEFLLPLTLKDWIMCYDNNEQVLPFEYELEVLGYDSIGL